MQTSNAKLVFHIEDLYTPITYVETRNIIDCFIEIKIDIHEYIVDLYKLTFSYISPISISLHMLLNIYSPYTFSFSIWQIYVYLNAISLGT